MLKEYRWIEDVAPWSLAQDVHESELKELLEKLDSILSTMYHAGLNDEYFQALDNAFDREVNDHPGYEWGSSGLEQVHELTTVIEAFKEEYGKFAF